MTRLVRDFGLTLVITAWIAFGVGCTTNSSERPLAMNNSLEKTDVDLIRLRAAAKSGDGEAAYELCQYFGFVAFDSKRERYWLERAVELKYKPAIVSLGNLLIESSSPIERRRGQELLRQVGKR